MIAFLTYSSQGPMFIFQDILCKDWVYNIRCSISSGITLLEYLNGFLQIVCMHQRPLIRAPLSNPHLLHNCCVRSQGIELCAFFCDEGKFCLCASEGSLRASVERENNFQVAAMHIKKTQHLLAWYLLPRVNSFVRLCGFWKKRYVLLLFRRQKEWNPVA